MITNRFDRLRALLGPWGMLYVVTVSLTALGLMLWVLSGNGADSAVLAIMAIGLPGSLFAAFLGVGIEILVLVGYGALSSGSGPADAGGSGSRLSPAGYALWIFIWLIYTAVMTTQAVAAKLLIEKLGRAARRPRWCPLPSIYE